LLDDLGHGPRFVGRVGRDLADGLFVLGPERVPDPGDGSELLRIKEPLPLSEEELQPPSELVVRG
jgi:hypothetical protein